MAIRVYDHGTTYGISIGQAEIRGFCLGWPDSGLGGLKALWVTFHRANGNLTDLLKKGTIDTARMNAAALEALVNGMRRYAEADLRITPNPDGNWRVDWGRYLDAQRDRKAKARSRPTA